MAKKKAVRRTPSKKSEITWHFFVPGAVGGAMAFIFGSGLMLAIEVFVVVVVATWVIRKYGQQ